MCCSRRIQRVELDPNNIAVRGRDGKLDTLGAFAKGEIVCALRGHPACVQDLCRSLHDERSLFLRKREFLENDIPRVRDGVGRWRGRGEEEGGWGAGEGWAAGACRIKCGGLLIARKRAWWGVGGCEMRGGLLQGLFWSPARFFL